MAEPLSDTPKPGRKLGSLKMVAQATARYPGHLAIALIALLTTTATTLSLTYVLRLVIDGRADAAHDRAFSLLFVLVGVLAIATAVRFYFVSWLGERTVADVRVAVQANLLRLEPGWFEENRPSEIASRLTADTAQIEMAVGTTVSVALRNLLTGIGGLGLLFYYDSSLAGMLVIGIPVVVLPIVLLGRRVRATSRSSQDRIADIGAMAVETLSAMKVVQAFSQEQRESDRFAVAVDHGFTAAKRRILIRAVMTSLVIGLLFGGLALLLRTMLGAVSVGVISAGTLLAFVTTSVLVAGAFGALTCRVPLSHAPGRVGAARFLARYLTGPNGRGGRPVRRGQVDLVPADPALLRPTVRQHHDRRSRATRCRPR
jgi:ATP-binding cassette subfamily B protein